MSLTEIMSAAGLEGWAEVGLVAFLLLFAAVLVYTFIGRNRPIFDRASRLPLDDAPRAARESDDHE